MKAHCLFEQSGTFKNEFRKLGIEAYDYDILDDFGQTDYKINIFEQIQKAYEGGVSIFDKILREDIVMAFFPCTRFKNQSNLNFRGENYGMKNWDDIKKLENCMRLHKELDEYYQLICKMAIVGIRKGIKIIIENPYSKEHYLQRYWCLKPKLIDKNRMERGDFYKKPTQFWWLNCEPKNNLIFEVAKNNSLGVKDAIRKIKMEDVAHLGVKNIKVARSMIHPDYANRFIREFILD